MTPWTTARNEPHDGNSTHPSSTRGFIAATLLLIALPCLAYAMFASALLLPFPLHLNIAIGGSLAAALVIVAVAAVAPASQRLQFVTWSAVLSVATELMLVYFLYRESTAGVVPAIAGTVTAAVWLVPGCVPLVRRSAIVLSFLYVVLLLGCFLDWPAIPDAVPYQLATIIDSKSMDRFYSYPLASFIDSERLWRIDARPEVLDSIAAKSGMSLCAEVPGVFWRMPPYYWPRAIPKGGRVYCTPSFPANGRGPDGWHFIMAVDANRSRAFVWFKNNF